MTAPSRGVLLAASVAGGACDPGASAAVALLPAPMLRGLLGTAAAGLPGGATITMATVRVCRRLAAPAASARSSSWLRRARGPATARSGDGLASPAEWQRLCRRQAGPARAGPAAASAAAAAVAAAATLFAWQPEASAPTNTTSASGPEVPTECAALPLPSALLPGHSSIWPSAPAAAGSSSGQHALPAVAAACAALLAAPAAQGAAARQALVGGGR